MKKYIIFWGLLVCWFSLFAQVQKVAVPSGTNLLAVDFPTQLTGYAGGYSSKIFRTFNGGLTWDSLSIKFWGVIPNAEVRQIQFLNENEGFIMGGITRYQGQILYTSDKGANWTEITPDSAINIQSMHFTSNQAGVAGDAFNRIWRTTNGGLTWQYYTTPDYASGALVTSPQPNLVYAAGSDGTFNYKGMFFRSVDSGKTFTPVYFPDTYSEIDGISFPTATHGYLLNYGFNYSRIFRTTNGGQTWDTIYPVINPTQLFFASADTGFAIAGGDIYQTNNRGLNFTRVYDADTLKEINRVISRHNRFYGAGLKGTVVYSGSTATGLQNAKERLPMAIYPNPVSQYITISLEEGASYPLRVTLYHADGRLLAETKLTDKESQINTGELPCGLYLLLADDGRKLYQARLLKVIN